MPAAEFTKEDAESLISIAQDAPIPGGARQAAARSELYQRFVRFYERTAKTTAPRKPPRMRSHLPTAEDLTK